VHRLDAAHLFRLALEKGSSGARYHGVAEEGMPLRDIADVIGRRLNVPVVGKSAEHFGLLLKPFVSIDNPASSKLTQERLGWRPTQPGLIPDLESAEQLRSLNNPSHGGPEEPRSEYVNQVIEQQR
jgi:nucleoside-diphosphate-sugar epimerase